MRSTLRILAAISPLILGTATETFAQPLNERIDQLIATGYPDYAKQAAPIASDAEFLRRVTLDLNGTIPTTVETRAFLADKASDKRVKVIDKLLASPAFVRQMTQHFNVMLMERRPDSKVAKAAWDEYLSTSFEKNKPYDVMVKEILSSDGVDPKSRASAKFMLDRDLEPNIVVRDMGRLFLGRNLQCAQCHDSPIVDDYKQEHYYGLLAFINRAALFPNPRLPTAMIGEKAEGEVNFTSVFDKNKIQKTTGPKVLTGKALSEPKLEKGKEYKVAPTAPTVRPVPTFSRRELLAAALVESPAFPRNIANRLWAMMMGRGLVHPLDLDHKDNPPSHPELLDLLSKEMLAHKYDMKWFIRELVLSKTYQRSSEVPEKMKDPPADRYLVAVMKPLSPEQFAYALMQATGLADSERQALGAKATDAALAARLAPQVPAFVRMFGSQAGQPEDSFQASLDQTLFLKHNSAIRGFIQNRPGNLLNRTMVLKDPKAIADELFLSVFSRPATEEEKKDIAEVLKGGGEQAPILSEIIWAMLATAEFRFNH
ncbi:MAG: DUF1549 and DUF1553 domain-containing protein [Planctomycetes bacterium]|nr:DUF1549 and DUF1553 domain-containing protein [Planctomycetota bacterium]